MRPRPRLRLAVAQPPLILPETRQVTSAALTRFGRGPYAAALGRLRSPLHRVHTSPPAPSHSRDVVHACVGVTGAQQPPRHLPGGARSRAPRLRRPPLPLPISPRGLPRLPSTTLPRLNSPARARCGPPAPPCAVLLSRLRRRHELRQQQLHTPPRPLLPACPRGSLRLPNPHPSNSLERARCGPPVPLHAT